MSNKHKQDIKTSEIEREQSQTQENLFRGSSTLAQRPRLQHYEGFSLKNVPTGSLGAATPTTKFTLELLWTL